ncbi:TetR/AcrR family transcriptional regulator [Burkholderia sp. USMB20]|uniref:TetR/AcrR family transcriptional regulator n=1 Tax=Burkholderia sp. USMB20 TaxID=1571773 RepID=UPI0005CE61B9|nr:helix-turn-helix domain-containing protein [Burkholderia sp. USMB20]TGN99180.1 TetR/AcrR family transcriptional regulator [Burkholderia sp. USMB20]
MKEISSRPARSSSKRRTQAERSETTQRKVIASAIRLLQKVGFQETNLQEIARGAKVTLGAVQHQFGTRTALMERVVDEVMQPLGELGAVWPDEGLQFPLEERASRFVHSAWDSVYGPPSYVAAWSLFFGCKTSPQLFKRINEHRAKHDPSFFAHFVAVFPEIARTHPEPEQFAAVIFAALRGLSIMRLFETNEEATEKQLQVVVQMIVDAGKSGVASNNTDGT